MRFNYLIIALLFFGILLIGQSCGGSKVTGSVTAELDKKTIKDGEITTIAVNGENSGKVAAEVLLKVTSEDPEKIKISYPGSLEDVLQPGENIGKKIIKVQGFTDHTSTTYWIKARLISKTTRKLLDEKKVWITVKK